MDETRVLAIDWSGRHKADQRKYIWLCEIGDGGVQRLERGRSRREVVEHLVDLANADPMLVVGVDFAFGVPAWYLLDLGLSSPRELWSLLALEALTSRMSEFGLRAWMANPEWPFWRTKRPADLTPDREFRRTEVEVARGGMRPTSVFKLVGPSQVGPASLYGWQALHQLADHGFSIWPFDDARPPTVIEIYPRLLTGRVIKSDSHAREEALTRLELRPEARADATADDNAFDALLSALAMSRSRAEFATLSIDPAYSLEGRIWEPKADDGLAFLPATWQQMHQ